MWFTWSNRFRAGAAVFKILLSGNDFRLLETRASVLQKTGASVVFYNTRDSLRVLDEETFSLVVLCHSLSDEEVMMIAGKVNEQRQNHQTKILMVATDMSRAGLFRTASIDATTLPEPGGLIAKATQLLQPVGVDRLDRAGYDAFRG